MGFSEKVLTVNLSEGKIDVSPVDLEKVEKESILKIQTPGGGGYGKE